MPSSAKVQENLAGMAVVRAYTMEAGGDRRRFGRLNGEFLVRSLRLARTPGRLRGRSWG